MVSVERSLPLAILGAALLTGLLTVVAPMLALVAAVGLAFVVVTLVDLSLGVVLFVFAACFFEAVPQLNDVSVAKVIGLVVAFSWLGSLVFKQGWRDQLFSVHPAFTVLLVLLTTWCMASALWAEDSGAALSGTLRIALNALLIPIVYSAVESSGQLRRLLVVFAVGLVGSAAYGVALSGGSPGAGGRLEGAGLDPNYLALWLVVAATLCAGVAVRRRMDPLARGLVILVGIACIAVTLPTASRTGLVALAVVGVAAPFVVGPGRRLAAAAAAGLLGLGAVVYFVRFAPPDVVSHVIASDDGGSGRTDIWKIAGRMIEDHPLTGVGLANLPGQLVHYLLEPGSIRYSDNIIDFPKVAHNTYLGLTAELGLIGIGLYAAVVLASVGVAAKAARTLRRAGRRDDELLARAIVLAMLAMIAGATFVSLENTKPLWLLIALGLVAGRLAHDVEPEPQR